MRVPATAVAHAVLLLFALHQCLSTFVDTVRLSKSVTMPPIHRIHKPQRAPEPVEEESVPVPCDTIPTFQQVWDGYVPDHLGMHAAVFTPYHITPGGGEKYLLSIVQALQFAGYSVIVYTYRGNSCTSKQKLLETAASLRVDLRADMLDLQLWHPSAPPVRIFFALGNEKFPQVHNIGILGFFMCQFPFDLDSPMTDENMAAWGSFDYVFLNSRFSFKWYNNFMAPAIHRFHDESLLVPSIDILHPPCSILKYDAMSQRQNIVMLGRFFQGRQSKGHVFAIQMFSRLVQQLPQTTRLVLIGQLVQGHDAYLASLRTLVTDLKLTGRVDFVISAPPEVVGAYLHTAVVQWHLTGLDVDIDTDPASREHFGISIVECMSAGCIPIALHGGPDDIIEHGVDGFLAGSADDVSTFTVRIFSSTPETITTMRNAAVIKAEQFSYASFQKRFLFFVSRGLLTRPYRHFLSSTMLTMRSCATVETAVSSPMTAMIVEGRNSYALEYVIYNTMSILRRSSYKWSLHLYYTAVNYELVRRIVSVHGLRHTHLHELPTTILDVSAYNQMMKSEEIWKTLGNAEKVLVFQTDSLIVRPGIERFLKYDYAGAPWHKQNERWEQIYENVPIGVGNGGFALRSVSVMRDIARQYGNQSEPIEQEDIFYAKHIFKDYLLCPRHAAYEFCLEVPCDDLKMPPDAPFAVHAAWYYNPLKATQELLYQSLLSSVNAS